MLELLIQYEAPLRFGAFLAVFAALAAWEIAAPRRQLLMPKAKRWLANIGILMINVVLVRAVAPAAAVGIAMFAEQRGIGLLHAVDWPQPLERDDAAAGRDELANSTRQTL